MGLKITYRKNGIGGKLPTVVCDTMMTTVGNDDRKVEAIQPMAFEKWPVPQESLSKRAVEILRLLAEGLSDREIAEQLVMTLNTIKWYNRQIYSILGVGSRTQAIARARELQLLDDDASAPSFNVVPHAPRHNLPLETTRFIGRMPEIAEGKRLLDANHLLTLVGSPGTGKTRLALQIGWAAADSFRDGVYFVSLASLSNPGLVMNAIAGAIGAAEMRGQPFIETLKHLLRDRHMLLILDNFEHLLPAATQVSELLAAAPNLKVLATSREPLHLYGEQEYVVPPLMLPNPEHFDLGALADCESIALFVQAAQAVRSDFELTPENAADVAQICTRLEGLPLAIELAAARIKLLTPPALLARLMSRLDTLTGGAQDLPPRQRTLRSTIEWSYNLLDDDEKMLFERLAVFRGGCSLEAIEAVCGQKPSSDIFDGLDSLVNKSLIRQQASTDGEPRFIMLETIYEYAWERLRISGETQAMQRRHAEYFAPLAEQAEPGLREAAFSYWMERLGTEEDNLEIALEWSFDGGDVELGLRLVAALRDFWGMSGRFSQGQKWTQHALSESESAPPNLRVRILIAAGVLLYISSQRLLQKQFFEQAIDLARQLDDKWNLAWALIFLGATHIRFAAESADYAAGLAAVEEGLALFQELENKPGMVQAFNLLGELRRAQGDDEGAQAAYEECLRLAGETGEIRREAMMLSNIGFIAMHREEVNKAKKLFRQGLIKSRQVGYDKRLVISHVLLLAGAIAANGELQAAVRLFGAADALFRPAGVGLSPADQPEHERILVAVRDQLDEATFQACWDEGRTFSLEQAVALALEYSDS
jgi:predicted ATPase/DNA-binding CsgD family transcriptional regulator